MFTFGSGINIRGGFWGATMLHGYRYHDANGELKSSGNFYDFSEIDPPDIIPTTTTTTTTTTAAPVAPGQPTNLNITVEDGA